MKSVEDKTCNISNVQSMKRISIVDFALGLHTFLFMYIIVKKVNSQNFSMVLNNFESFASPLLG